MKEALLAFCVSAVYDRLLQSGCEVIDMNLGPRLEAVAALAGTGRYKHGADIGTDHAKLAIELARRGICQRVIAADKNAGPCEAARRAISGENLSEIVEVRQGDGLAALAPGEAELITIAGMGGGLMLSILAAGRDVLVNNPKIILQPQTDIPEVRRRICREGWKIADEAIAEENGHIYVVLAVDTAVASVEDLTDEQFVTGVFLQKKAPELWKKYAEENIAKLRRALAGMERGKNAGASPEYVRQKHELTVWEMAL